MFRITARTVLELGSELISSDIIAFYELIKNGFDARTKNGVEIKFDIVLSKTSYNQLIKKISKKKDLKLETLQELIIDSLDKKASEYALNHFKQMINSASTYEELLTSLEKAVIRYNTITISDTGEGMSEKDLINSYLVIGTPSRKKEVDKSIELGESASPYLGEKGIGRLSAMRLGEYLKVETARKIDTKVNILRINWRNFSDLDAMLDQIPVAPEQGAKKKTEDWSGTSIIISDLTENWTENRVTEMAEYDFARLVDPFKNVTSRPRIAIFWNNIRKTIPHMPKDLLDLCHAKVKGKYEIIDNKPSVSCTFEALDLGFEHPRETDTINIALEDLQGLIAGKDQHVDDSAFISVGPFDFEAYWYNRRRLASVDGIGEQKAVRELQQKWSGIMLFRDNFRVFPYGEENDDWLKLDRKALRRKGYILNKTQFIGKVCISRNNNPYLVDQTNREGLRITPQQQVFLEVISYCIQDKLGDFIKDVERQYKNQKVDLSDAQSKVSKLETRAKTAIRQLQKITPPEGNEAVEDLNQALLEFSEFAEKARQRIKEVEEESQQMIEMAGVGLMVEVVAHELARASENALKALDVLKDKEVPENLRAHFNILQAEMKSVSKRVKMLDPMSISSRQKPEIFILNDLIADILEAHKAQFIRHRVELNFNLTKERIKIKAVKGMIVQILENLISNSIYWLDLRTEREIHFQAKINLLLENNPPTIFFEDNGNGIAPENNEKIFKAFFSLKDSKRRRGLGLFIAREAAEYNNGTLYLSDKVNPETGRLHQFVLELSEDI
ncbi:sensor histidine kinase [Acinetobacter pittii]|uniref:sensor histidine kinase n=1 Tax=Acinetobacter pittii TaxID=48296 RepID=UPI002E18BE10|nr:sensor histidine kinase [Acinetobacter pittii]